jgi:hypothetical protein
VSKYAFIDARRAEFHVVDLCRVGGVSTSGFYDWQARQTAGPSEAERLEAELVAEIREIHARSRSAYGCPRVVGALHQQGRRVNHKRVERLMAAHNISGRCGRRRVRTTIRDPHARPATDLVNRCFNPTGSTSCGSATSPTSRLGRAGCTCRACLTPARVDYSAGRWPGTCAPTSSLTHWRRPSVNAAADTGSAVSCSTVTMAARPDSTGRSNTSFLDGA